MIRINTLNRCGQTLTIELMGYINKTEFDILYDCMESYVEEGITEVCIVANEVRSIGPWLERDAIRLGQLGLTLRFQQLAPSIQRTLVSWGLQAWIDDECDASAERSRATNRFFGALADFAAASDFPNRFQPIGAQRVEMVVEVDGGAAVAGDKFEQVAGVEVGAGTGYGLEAAVFFGQGVAFQIGSILDEGEAVLGRQALEAGVGDDLLGGRAAGNGGQYAEGVFEAQAELGVGRVHQRVRASLNLGDAVEGSADVVIARARGAANRAVEAGAFHVVAGIDEALEASAGTVVAGVFVFEIDDVAFVAHQAAEAQVWCLGNRAGEIDDGGGCDAAAVVADVDLHEDAGADLVGVGGLVEVGEVLRVINRDHDVATGGQGHETLDLAAAYYFVGNEDVLDAGGRHDLGLSDLGAGDPLCAG